jgi:hypothetical protein
LIAAGLGALAIGVLVAVYLVGTWDDGPHVTYLPRPEPSGPNVAPPFVPTPPPVVAPIVKGAEAPPALGPELRLIVPEALTLEPGKRYSLKVKVVRRDCPGRIQLGSDVMPKGIGVLRSEIAAESDEGSLELVVAPDAAADNADLIIIAVADKVRSEHTIGITVKHVEAKAGKVN